MIDVKECCSRLENENKDFDAASAIFTTHCGKQLADKFRHGVTRSLISRSLPPSPSPGIVHLPSVHPAVIVFAVAKGRKTAGKLSWRSNATSRL